MLHQNRFALVLVALVSFSLGVVIVSPPPLLFAFEPSAKATPTISKRMNAHQVDNVHAAKTPVKNRLLALDSNAKFPLSVMPEGVQRRVSGNCVVGSAVRIVNSDGSVQCETIPASVPTATAVPTPTRNPADITSVIASTGLKGGGIHGDVSLSADTAYLQRRVNNQCAAGAAIRSIGANGSVTCENINSSPGDITSVSAGPGLVGGGADADVTLAVNFSGSGNAISVARSDHNHNGTYLANSGGTITGDLTINGDLRQPGPGHGAVKAGVYTDCGPANVIRYFNNVNDSAITVTSALSNYGCTIDFGFDLTNSFIVATAFGDCNTGCSSLSFGATVRTISGTKATLATWAGNNQYQTSIFVLVY